MTIEELRGMKQKMLDKYINGGKQDKTLRKQMRDLDVMIERKLENQNNAK